MQKGNKFHLPHYEIPQLPSMYFLPVLKRSVVEIPSRSPEFTPPVTHQPRRGTFQKVKLSIISRNGSLVSLDTCIFITVVKCDNR